MARFPAPAKMSKLPPATPSSRCHGRGVKPLAWVANAAPMKVAPSAGSARAKAAAWSCQAISKAGLGSARPSAASTTAMCVVMTQADTAASVAPAATVSRDQLSPGAATALHEPAQSRDEQQEQRQDHGLQTHGYAPRCPRFPAWAPSTFHLEAGRRWALQGPSETPPFSMTTHAAKATAAAPTIRVVDTRFPAATAGVAASLTRVPPIADLVSVFT